MNLIQIKKIRDNFIEELNLSERKNKTSLPFIINPLPSKKIVKNEEVFQAIVVGGSMGKIAKLKNNTNGLEILSTEEKEQPRFDSYEIFMEYLENQLHVDTKILAVDFAFPLSPILEDGILDGILLRGTKEHLFHGLVGKKIGEEISNYFLKKRGQKILVSCANDTVCLLLSGLTKYSKDNLACGILGTGMNAAFFLDENKCVNLESASFDKFPKSPEGEIIDASSTQPGTALFEKEITGAYLYKHFNLIIKEKGIDFKPINSTLELKNLSHENSGEVSKIANELLDKSAAYISAQIAAISEFKKRDMVFVMDGSFFWESTYKKRVDEMIPRLTNYKIELVEIKNNTVLGPAQLVI